MMSLMGNVKKFEVINLKWEQFLTEEDIRVYRKTGYGKQHKIGDNPALLVIDVTYEFVGFEPKPILESIETFTTSCGEKGWKSVGVIKELLHLARSRSIPVIYTNVDRTVKSDVSDPWSDKKSGNKWHELDEQTKQKGMRFVKEIEPMPNELVITKHAPSAFCGTPLIYFLKKLNVDSLIITGGTTSGCIRASVVDAFSYGFKVTVVEEAVFDRFEASHWINLFDMHAKFANVVKVHEIKEYLRRLN
jgi:maleamate amidohydrolase